MTVTNQKWLTFASIFEKRYKFPKVDVQKIVSYRKNKQCVSSLTAVVTQSAKRTFSGTSPLKKHTLLRPHVLKQPI